VRIDVFMCLIFDVKKWDTGVENRQSTLILVTGGVINESKVIKPSAPPLCGGYLPNTKLQMIYDLCYTCGIVNILLYVRNTYKYISCTQP